MNKRKLVNTLSFVLAFILFVSSVIPLGLAEGEGEVIVLSQVQTTESEIIEETSPGIPESSVETLPVEVQEFEEGATEIQIIPEEPDLPPETTGSDASETVPETETVPDVETPSDEAEESPVEEVHESGVPVSEVEPAAVSETETVPTEGEIIPVDISGSIVNAEVHTNPAPDKIKLTTGQVAETIFYFESCKNLDEMRINIKPANTELVSMTIPAFQGANGFSYDICQITDTLTDGRVTSTERTFLAENCSGNDKTTVNVQNPEADDSQDNISYETYLQIIITGELLSFATGSNGIKVNHRILSTDSTEAGISINATYKSGDASDSSIIGTAKYTLCKPSIEGIAITSEDTVTAGEVVSITLAAANTAQLHPEKAVIRFSFDSGTLSSLDLGDFFNGGTITFNQKSRDEFISALQSDPEIKDFTLEISDYGTFQPFSMNDIFLGIRAPETGEKIHIGYSTEIIYSSTCSVSNSVSKDISISIPTETKEPEPDIESNPDEESETSHEEETEQSGESPEGTELPSETSDTPSTEEPSDTEPDEPEAGEPEDSEVTDEDSGNQPEEPGTEENPDEPDSPVEPEDDQPEDENLPEENPSETDDPGEQKEPEQDDTPDKPIEDPSGTEDPPEDEPSVTDDPKKQDEPEHEDIPDEPVTPDEPVIPEVTALKFDPEELTCAPASPYTYVLDGYTVSDPDNVQAIRFTLKPVSTDTHLRILFNGTVESYKIVSVSSDGIASVLPQTSEDPTIVDFDSLLLTDAEETKDDVAPVGHLPEDAQFIWLYVENPSQDFSVEEFTISGYTPDTDEPDMFTCDTNVYVSGYDDPAVSLTATGKIIPTEPDISMTLESSTNTSNINDNVTYTCSFANSTATRFQSMSYTLAAQPSFKPVTFFPGVWDGYNGTVTVTALDANRESLESFISDPSQSIPLVFSKDGIAFIQITPAEPFSGLESITGMSITGIYTEPGTFYITGYVSGQISDKLAYDYSSNPLGITVSGPVETPTPVPTATPSPQPTEVPTNTPEPTPEPTDAPYIPVNPPVVNPTAAPTSTPVPLSVTEPVISGTSSTIAYGDNALFHIRELAAEGIKANETFVLHLMIPTGVQVRSLSIPDFSTTARVSIVYESGSIDLGTFSEAHTASLTDREGTNIRYIAIQIKNAASVRAADELSIILKNISARDRVATLQAIASVRDAKTAVLEQKYDKYNIALSGPTQAKEPDTSDITSITEINGAQSAEEPSLNEETQIDGYHPMLFGNAHMGNRLTSVKAKANGFYPLLFRAKKAESKLQLNTRKPFNKCGLLARSFKWQVQMRYRLSLTQFPFKHTNNMLFR